MTDWSVLGGDPVPQDESELRAAIAHLARQQQSWTDVHHRLQRLFDQTPTVWRGESGAAWSATGAGYAGRLRTPVDHLHKAEQALSAFAAVIGVLRPQADAVLAKAESVFGELSDLQGPFGPLSPEQFFLDNASPAGVHRLADLREQAATLRTRVGDLRRQADQIRVEYRSAAQTCARSLNQIATDGMLATGRIVSNQDLTRLADLAAAEAAGDPDRIGALLTALPAGQRAAIFADLAPAARSALASTDPGLIGNLDGVPLDVRAEVNHAQAEQDLQAAILAGDNQRAQLLQGLLIDGTSLVLYDPAKDHYGVLFGDVRTAKNVAVFVPGVGDDGNVAGWVNDAARIAGQTADTRTAVIMWKGYDDPGDHGTLDKAAAGFDNRARDGATALTGFCTAGLGLTGGQSLTVVAHSYGSVVTGAALADDGLRPHRVVTAGSPGMTVDQLSQLHLQAGQLYAEHAPGDYVANNLGGLGTDPASPAFGAIRLRTNATGLPTVSGHSEYFNANTQALGGIADVITGNVTPADIQPFTTANQVGADAAHLVNPAGPLLDTIARAYRGPGNGRLQLLVHLDNGVAANVGTITQDAYTGASTVVHEVGHEIKRLTDLLP